MTANAQLFELVQVSWPDNYPGRPPSLLFGQGTPAGTLQPFSECAKGTLYIQTDATDNTNCIWQKVANASADADWLRGPATTGIVNADISAGAAIVGSKTTAKSRRQDARSVWFNLDNGAGVTVDDVILRPSTAVTLRAARIVYVDATSGTVAAGTVQIGTTVTGTDLVAATAYENSKAVGTSTSLTLASAAVAANTPIIVRHTGVAATAAGQSVVEIEYDVDD